MARVCTFGRIKMQFATCERNKALRFLQKLYPNGDITDTKKSAKAILDLVEKDIIRIPDPSMHGQQVAIYPSKNWDDLNKDQYMSILTKFHNQYK